MVRVLEKTMRLNYLLDFYQALLTDKQQKYMKMYYLEDFSLVEISQIANVSRQAIYDNIKRTELILESYEEKLFLYERFKKRSQLIDKLQQLAIEEDHQHFQAIINQLKEIS